MFRLLVSRLVGIFPGYGVRRSYSEARDPKLAEKIQSLCKRRGFVFPGSELYGGLAGAFDFGPLGIFLRYRLCSAGLHLAELDYVELSYGKTSVTCGGEISLPEDQIVSGVDGEPEPQHSAAGGARDCPHCRATGTVTAPREFNLLFRTTAGPTASGHEVYLRPETAQGIFLLFAPTLVATRRRLPFGLGQVGRSFRNEVSPANFLFRMREFEQMELEYFCRAEEAPRHYAEWVAFCERWLRTLGIREGSVRRVEHAPGDLAHYARACTDLEFLYPHGWGELWGVAHRGDYDLQQHQQGSGADLRYTDPDTGEKVLPHVVEPAVGLDRLMYAVLTDAYTEDRVGGEPRILLRLPRPLAPYPLAVLPLLRRADMVQAAAAVQARLPGADLDVTGSIGKRYRRQDEIGTPYCATVDERTLADGTVTLRDRDSTRQIRLHVDELVVRMRDPDFVFAFPDSAAVSGAASVAQ